MELWIRSQDRMHLRKINTELVIKGRETKGQRFVCISEYLDKEQKYARTLGGYETKERALEVLDEIQKLLSTETFWDRSTLDYYVLSKNISASKIYEMPKD